LFITCGSLGVFGITLKLEWKDGLGGHSLVIEPRKECMCPSSFAPHNVY
jgi:hypothetical protein